MEAIVFVGRDGRVTVASYGKPMTMTYVFGGTPEDHMIGFFDHLERARQSSAQADVEIPEALASLIGLVDRHAQVHPVAAERLEEFWLAACDALRAFPNEISAYVQIALVIAEGANDNEWYELCLRRSAIQLLIDHCPYCRGRNRTGRFIRSGCRTLSCRTGAGSDAREVHTEGLPGESLVVVLSTPSRGWNALMTPAKLQLASLIRSRARAVDLDLHKADLAGADLSGLGADRLKLTGVDLRGAKLSDARLNDCRLEHARADNSDWCGATLRMCVLDALHGAGTRFDGARIEDSTAIGADLSRASLRGTHLTETSFVRAVMVEAALDDAEGYGVEFRGADLGRATLARGEDSTRVISGGPTCAGPT